MTNFDAKVEQHLQDLYDESRELAKQFEERYFQLLKINEKRASLLARAAHIHDDPKNYFYEQEQQILDDLRAGRVRLAPANPNDTVRLRRYTVKD